MRSGKRSNTLDKLMLIAIASIMLFTFNGCQVIGGIFKTGLCVGLIIATIIIAIVIWIAGKFRK